MIKKSTLVYIMLVFAVLLQNLFFHIINPTSTTTIMLMADIFAMFIFSYFVGENHKCRFLYRYITSVLLVVVIPQTIYGFAQGQTFNEYIDVIKGPIYILLAVPVMKIFDCDESMTRVLNMIEVLTVISLAILLANSIMLNEFGHPLLPFDYFQLPPNGRNNRLRLLLISDFLSFVSIYSFSSLVSKTGNLLFNFLSFVICFGAELYIEQTRMIEMAIIAACIIIYAISIDKKKYKFLLYLIAVTACLYGLFADWFSGVFSSFSIQNTSTGVSTLYRTIEWKAALELIIDHPFMGTGMIRNYRFSVNLTGIPVMFDHTDIGLIGTITYIGMIGTFVLFLIPYYRCFTTFLRIQGKKQYDRDRFFFVGLFVFITVTAATIIVTDNSRIFVWPFILAVEEYTRRICILEGN